MEDDQSSATASADEDVHPEDDLDHCLCDIDIDEEEATDDSALPAAEGGVAPDED